MPTRVNVSSHCTNTEHNLRSPYGSKRRRALVFTTDLSPGKLLPKSNPLPRAFHGPFRHSHIGAEDFARAALQPAEPAMVTSSWRDGMSMTLVAMACFLGGAGIALWALTRRRRRSWARPTSLRPDWTHPPLARHSSDAVEEVSRRREALLRRALRAGRMIAWEYDLQTGHITIELDREVFSIRHLPSKMTLRKVLSRVHEADRPSFWNRALASLERNEPFIQQLRLKLERSGEYLWMENHASVLSGADGGPVSLAGTMIDFTAHKRAIDALVENDRRKDLFLATLAHELRSPLASLRAAAHLLAQVRLDLDERHACIEAIRQRSRHLTQLVNDLLDVGRITHNQLRLERMRLDLRTCVREATEMVQHLADERQHSLTTETPLDAAYVYGDPVRIVQVLVNLLTNAIKYTPPRGRIDVTIHQDGSRIAVRVRDTGPGIPADQQTRVFEPFYQVANAARQSPCGLGLGLALARRIVELHDGTIELVSGAAAQGCEFTVWLPLLSGLPAQNPQGTMLLPTDRPRRILLADNNPDMAETMAVALRVCGHTVRVAVDGAEALAIADEFQPEVAFLDVDMPKIPGPQLAQTLRRRDWAGAMTLVALTAWNPDHEGNRPDLTPFDSHLLKPAQIDRIGELIRAVAHRRSNGLSHSS